MVDIIEGATDETGVLARRRKFELSILLSAHALPELEGD
jgi:hypothetical protein